MKKIKVKKIKIPKKIPVYKASFILNNQIVKAEGDNLAEVFHSMIIEGKIPFAKAVLKVEKGELKSEKMMYPIIVKRFKINKFFRELLAKRLTQALH